MKAIYKLHYHPAAENDLFQIFTLIENYAGFDTATRKMVEIEHVTKSLVDFPYKGSIRDDAAPDVRAIPAADKAVVCFSIDEEQRSVFVLAVSYAGSDWISRVKERH